MTQDPANPTGEPPREGDEGAGGATPPGASPYGPTSSRPDGTPAEGAPPAGPGGGQPGPAPTGPPVYGDPGAYGAPTGAPGYPPPGGPGYPPPGGPGYPPPGGAGYPPPGGAGYPPPGGAGYDAPSGPGFAVGDAISYGWRKVTSNLGPWILVALIFLAINVAWSWISGGFDQLQDQYDFTDTNAFAVTGITFTSVLLGIVGTVIGYLITAFFTRGALDEVDGRRPDVAAFFRIGNVLNVLLAALIVGILAGIGFVLCILPGFAVLLFSPFVYYVALDQNRDAITAVRTSFSLVAKNFGQVFLLLLALFGINIVGAIPCGLGLFVTIPLSYVAVGYAYRRLTGGVPAP